MDIFLYDNNNRQYIKFPVIPKSIEVQSPQKIDNFETLGKGDLKIIGLKGNRKFSLESFFPNKDYAFLRDRTYKGIQYVNLIELWRNNRTPMTILISDLNINFKCVMESFNYSIQDGSGDIYYNINIEEYKIPEIIKTSATIVTLPENQNVAIPSETVDFQENSYGIVTAKNGLNVRNGAGIGYDKIGNLSYNQKIKLYRLEDGWWNIYYSDRGGYVDSNYIRRI